MPKSIVIPDSEENDCPLATIKALGFTANHPMSSSNQTFNLYGISYKVLGATDLTLYVGAIKKEVYCLVVDITADYDLLFGKPWVEDLKNDPFHFI